MDRALNLAKWALAVILAASTTATLTESYRAELDWASTHGLTQFFSWIWPLQIDVFIAVGELALFIAIALMWPVWVRVSAAVVGALGLAASVAANVGHVTGQHNLTSNRLTGAVPPLAAAISLVVGMVALHFITAYTKRDYTPRHAAELAALPSDARRIIYAAEITSSREPRELVAWLHDNGHTVSAENVRTVLRRNPLALSNGHQEPPE